MTTKELTYKDFVEKIAKKFYSICLSENLKSSFSAIYGIENFYSYKDKEIIETIIVDYIHNNDLNVSNIHDLSGEFYRNDDIKSIFILQALPFLIERYTNREIVRISQQNQTFYLSLKNNVLFDVVTNHILETANNFTSSNNIVITNLYLSESIDYLSLSKSINRAISKKLPIVFLLWENSFSGFREIDKRLAYYGGFFNTLANYSSDKVTYKSIDYNNIIETTKTIKSGIDKARNNIPAVFTISQDLTQKLSATEIYKEWIIKSGIISKETLEKIENIAHQTVKSHISKNYPEKFFYNLCKALNKDECSPEKGFELFINGEKLPDNFIKEYKFASVFNNFNKRNSAPLEISYPTTKQEMKLAAQYGQKLIEQGTFIMKNVPENEFLYVYFSLKKNVFRLPIPQSTVILNLKNQTFAEKLFPRVENVPGNSGIFLK
jgi:hypothetical protein